MDVRRHRKVDLDMHSTYPVFHRVGLQGCADCECEREQCVTTPELINTVHAKQFKMDIAKLAAQPEGLRMCCGILKHTAQLAEQYILGSSGQTVTALLSSSSHTSWCATMTAFLHSSSDASWYVEVIALLDSSPASHVDEVFTTNDIVGKASNQRGCSGCGGDLLGHSHLHQML